MEDEKVVIKNVRVEYISTKTDKYDNELIYFKIKDKNIELKFANIVKDGFHVPWFKSDKGQHILKVKPKYAKLKELAKDIVILTDITFNYYKMNDIQGFYVCSIC